jgi:hypothetical protein
MLTVHGAKSLAEAGVCLYDPANLMKYKRTKATGARAPTQKTTVKRKLPKGRGEPVRKRNEKQVQVATATGPHDAGSPDESVSMDTFSKLIEFQQELNAESDVTDTSRPAAAPAGNSRSATATLKNKRTRQERMSSSAGAAIPPAPKLAAPAVGTGMAEEGPDNILPPGAKRRRQPAVTNNGFHVKY